MPMIHHTAIAAGDTSNRRVAWSILAVAAIGHLFVVGAPGAALPMIYSPIVAEFGLSRSAVAIMASIKMVAGALISIAGGMLISRFGIRLVAALTTMIAGLSLIAYLWVDTVAGLYVASAVMGAATVFGMVVYIVMVSRWFNNNLGLAIAFASLGTSVGGAVTPFIMNWTIAAYGWRAAMAMLGPCALLVVPLILLVFRQPTEIEAAAANPGALARPIEPAPLGETPRELLRQPTFWIVGTALLLGSFADQSLIQHLVLYLRDDAGMTAMLAAAALALTFSAGFVGKLLFGFMFDRLSLYGVALCYIGLALGAWLMSPMLVLAVPILLSNTIRGLAHGGIIVDVPVAARHCFGPRPLGYVIGAWSAAASIGSAIGPYVVGLLRDHEGNYESGFAVIIAASIVAAVLMLLGNPAYRKATRGAIVG